MKSVLVVQHVPHEILGTFHPLLKEAGIRIRYANFGREPHPKLEMKRYDGLVVLGGPMGVYEADRYPHLRHEMDCIREAVESGKPVLGICLGAQLTAAALGAEVTRHQEREIGWYDLSPTSEGRADPVLREMGAAARVFQWHGDTFGIPPGAVRLAGSAVCENQAFRYGDNVYGFQFHLEVDEPLVERWLSVDSNRKDVESMGGAPFVDKVRAETRERIGALKELSRNVFGRYLELFSTRRRSTVLSSGHR